MTASPVTKPCAAMLRMSPAPSTAVTGLNWTAAGRTLSALPSSSIVAPIVVSSTSDRLLSPVGSAPSSLANASASSAEWVLAVTETNPPTLMLRPADAAAPPCITPRASAAPAPMSEALTRASAACVAFECWAAVTTRLPVIVGTVVPASRSAVVVLFVIMAATAAATVSAFDAPAAALASVS